MLGLVNNIDTGHAGHILQFASHALEFILEDSHKIGLVIITFNDIVKI